MYFCSHKLNPGELENNVHKEHEEDPHKKVYQWTEFSQFLKQVI